MKRASLKWKPEESSSQNAERVLPELVRAYFKAGRKLEQDSDARKMHRFRLKTKQLRYTLEAFADLFGPGLKHKTDSLRPIQSALGDLNDCEVLRAEMGDKLSHEVRAYLNKRSDQKRKEFLQYWRDTFDAKDEEKKWEQVLTRQPRTAKKEAPKELKKES